MALYGVTTGGVTNALDVNQYQQLLTGTMTDQQVTIANRIQATNTGAATASGYMGGVSGASPASGTFALGDLVIDQKGPLWVCTAAGTPGTWQASVVQVNTTTLGVSTATVTISSIPTTFNHLLCLVYARSDTAAVNANLVMQLNGATSGYQYVTEEFTPTLASGDNYAQGNIQVGKVPAATATAKYFWSGAILLDNTSGGASNFINATAWGMAGYAAAASNNNKYGLYGGVYQSAAAISSIKFGTTGNFVAGSQFSVYGFM